MREELIKLRIVFVAFAVLLVGAAVLNAAEPPGPAASEPSSPSPRPRKNRPA
jgi:hypothetical protein